MSLTPGTPPARGGIPLGASPRLHSRDWILLGAVAAVLAGGLALGISRYGAYLGQSALLAAAALLLVLCGTGLGWIVISRDRVREAFRAHADAARRADLEERLATVVRNAYDPFFLVAEDLRVLEFNERSLAVYGYTAEEMARLTIRDLRAPSTHGAIEEDVRGIPTGGGRLYETVHRRRDGSEFPVEVSVCRLRRGDAVEFQAFVRDISERRRAAEDLASAKAQFHQAQKMEAVGRLAGGVAHDFNNLLTVINGYSELLLGRLKPGDPARASLEEIRRAGTRAADLTRQLLTFSRRHVVQPRVLDLPGVLQGVEKMLRRTIGEDIDLRIETAADPWPVLADPGQMEQILMNLVVNARDAIPGNGTITIRTANAPAGAIEAFPADRDFVLLEVRDTGCGMTEEVRSRIFEPFFTTKAEGKGTGLGLATVYGIVHQAGGRIGVETAPGKGTAFRIHLPRAAAGAAPVEGAPGSAASPAPGGSEAILLVEDEQQVRSIAVDALRGAGYAIREAATPEEALAALGDPAARLDLLVTDVIMPRMDGRTLADRARGLRPGLRVLFMSGYTGENLVHAGVFAEEEFLQKPFTPTVLRRKVRAVLDARKP